MDAVITKGGPNANLYIYDPPAESLGDGDPANLPGTGLHSPVGPSGSPAGISHIEFCYDFDVIVSKTAQLNYSINHSWTIDKSVLPTTIDMFQGDSQTATYTVSVQKSTTYSNFYISGVISIQNPDPLNAANVSNIIDSLGAFSSIDCGTAFSISAGQTVNCNYTINLPGLTDPSQAPTLNSVTVQTTGAVGGGSANNVPIVLGMVTVNGFDSVNVSDSNGMSWGPTNGNAMWTYPRIFTCNQDEGTHDNTASIVETSQSDSASVTVNCYALTVTKDAPVQYDLKYFWDVDKTGSVDQITLTPGQMFDVQYTVTAMVTGSDTINFRIEDGNIWVQNPAPISANLTGVFDSVAGVGDALVSCPSLVIPANGSLHCSYDISLPDDFTGLNTATASLQNYADGVPSGTTNFTGTANVPTSSSQADEIDECVNVTDSYAGALGTACANESPKVFNYSRSITAPEGAQCSTFSVDNTATVTTQDSGTQASDDHNVSVRCFYLTVEKTAPTLYDRDWTWDIEKAADEDEITLSSGQNYMMGYTVTVSATSENINPRVVGGEITVYNSADFAVSLDSVTDMLSSVGALAVTCPSLEVPANGSLTCTYADTNLADFSLQTNVATVTVTTDGGQTSFSDSALVDPNAGSLGDEFDECVNVDDTLHGFLGMVCASGLSNGSYSFDYEHVNGPFDVCGDYEVPNTASFLTNDNGESGSASDTVIVHVPCEGCTLTPGYWKTHNDSFHGGAPSDDTWLLLPNAENTIFFLSGQSYYDVLWTSPQGGNAYYILARAYIAATLNQLNGAGSTPEVDAAISSATSLFNTYTPAQVGALKGKAGNALRSQFITLAGILDAYNNGLIGPGHCDEDATSG